MEVSRRNQAYKRCAGSHGVHTHVCPRWSRSNEQNLRAPEVPHGTVVECYRASPPANTNRSARIINRRSCDRPWDSRVAARQMDVAQRENRCRSCVGIAEREDSRDAAAIEHSPSTLTDN
eukprot:1115515-Prymnesium_polylepis.5